MTDRQVELFRLSKVFHWFAAVYAYDYGDAEPLADLMRTESTPPEFITAVSDIVAGTRPRNLKGGVKSKLPVKDRMKLAAGITLILGLDDLLLSPANVQKFAEIRVPDVEPAAMRRERQIQKKKDREDFANQMGVSVETVKNLLSEFNERIARWPVV